MLWEPKSVKKDEGEDEDDNVPVTPILVPLQNKPTTIEKNVPVLVPDVQDLKEQFQQQQNMLTQIKETLKQNESQLSSKGKQVEAYANRLSQIRARSKNTQGKKSNAINNPASSQKTVTIKSSKENLTIVENPEQESDKTSGTNLKLRRRGKVSELRKGLEENKIKFEERTGKEQSETKKIESLVEHLKTQLEERDKTIQDLQKNIEQPTPRPETLPKKPKQKSDKISVASKLTQTARMQTSDESIEVIALQNRIYELEANVLDLEENLKEKESVINARTQAVTLLSQDLSLKGKNTLESLEETRQEMRTMQTNFIAIEDQLKKDLLDRDNRLAVLEEKCKKLESTNFDLSLKNAEQQEKLVNMQTKYLEMETEVKSSKESIGQGHTDDKLEELTKKISVLTKELDDRNKSMIKMKVEHKNKIKGLNKTLETLKGTSDEKAEIIRLNSIIEEFENIKTGLENRVADLEDEKGNLLLSVLDVDDFKATEKKLKDHINELEIIIRKQSEDLTLHMHTISSIEKDKLDLRQSNQEQNILIENLYAKLQSQGENREFDQDSKLKELTLKIESMEADYNRKMEDLKAEHTKEIEMLESYYGTKAENLDRRELEEYRISTEISNIHVEEQIELLVREKQQLLEKLKSLSGVSSTDSLTFEKMEHSDLRDDKEAISQLGEEVDLNTESEGESRMSHLQRIVNDQQQLITELQKSVHEEKQKAIGYQQKVTELEGTMKHLEDVNTAFRQQIETAEVAEPAKNQKSNLNAKNKIKKIEMELAQSKKTIQEQGEKLQDLSLKLEEKEELIKKYTERIELFEKDDWDRQNHWMNTADDIANMQELQKKCLSLENSLIELNEDCERLRKENIEVVHLLSEEKVQRRKLLEEFQSKSDNRDAQIQKTDDDSEEIEKRLNSMIQIIEGLQRKVEKLEINHSNRSLDVAQESGKEKLESYEIADLEEKLEWTNVVLAGKETEIFRLQNLLEDRNKSLEVMEGDMSEYRSMLSEREKRLGEIIEELKSKEVQLEEISANFNKLQECVDIANQKTALNESQLKDLLTTVKEMEGVVFKKENELQEIKGILAEKNLDMTNLRNQLDEMDSHLTYSYQEHLENMGKCLRDKESDYDALLAEKNHLEDFNRTLVTEKEDIYNQNMELSKEKDKLQQVLAEKERIITELNENLRQIMAEKEKLAIELHEKMKVTETPVEAGAKPKNQEIEDMKIKMKKLAANLKKKAQNETDLLKQVKDMEDLLLEKDKVVEKLHSDVSEAQEKWTIEKSEKEQVRNELTAALNEKTSLENEKEVMRQMIEDLDKTLQNSQALREETEQLKKELDRMKMASDNSIQKIGQQAKEKIDALESQLTELSALYQNAESTAKGSQNLIAEEKKEKQRILQNLADKNEEIEDLQKAYEELLSEKSSMKAKLQEKNAVIESLETELSKVQEHMSKVEEKFFYSEERRLSLENKNEAMCKKIMEDSETLVTIDDLAIRVDDLLKSEKILQDSVKNLEAKNSELKQVLDELQAEKFNLETSLKSSGDKLIEISEELKQFKDSDSNKNNLVRNLTNELEKAKAESKQILAEYEKLNQDYEQCEVDFKENLENSQNLEKSLKHKIEELMSENASLTEKYNLISKGKSSQEEKPEEEAEEDKKPKKRKSVTFRTDEVEYIKDLKSQLHTYDDKLKEARKEIEELKNELFREKLRNEVSSVVAEAQEKVESLRSTPEKKVSTVFEPVMEKFQGSSLTASNPTAQERKFDANMFFGNENEPVSFFDQGIIEAQPKLEEPIQTNDFDSLMWDDGWGNDGHLEAQHFSSRVEEPFEKSVNDYQHYQEKIKSLESDIDKLQEENDRISKELKDQTVKYTKAIRKLKEQKVASDKLNVEINKLKSNSGFGDLDAAIVDELKMQIQNMEAKEKELLKNLDNAKLEKESLLKRIDVLNAGNEKFLEMKERQDNEVEIWQRKNNELLKEISELRQQISDPQIPDDNVLLMENRELKNKVEALEWKNCELNELLEEKQEILEGKTENLSSDVEKVMEEKSLLQKEIEELNNVRERLEKKLFDEEKKNSVEVGELKEQLTALATENETLQDILGEMKKNSDAMKKEKPKESKIFDYFRSSPTDDLFPVQINQAPVTHTDDNKSKLVDKELEIEGLKRRINELEEFLKGGEDGKNEVEVMKNRVFELENFIIAKEEELGTMQRKINELENFRIRLIELEGILRVKDEEIQQLGNFNLGKDKELEELRQNYIELKSVKDNDVVQLRQNIFELETMLRFKEEEILKMKSSQVVEAEVGLLQKKAFKLEGVIVNKEVTPGQFETIDLGLQSESLNKSEVEDLRQRNFELEDLLRMKEEELNNMHTTKWSNQEAIREVEELKQKVHELEELLKYKENEIYQIQSVKGTEIQTLNQKIFDLENELQMKDGMSNQFQQQSNDLQQKIFQLESTLQTKDGMSNQFQQQSSDFQQKIFELENLIRFKEEELERFRLEKSNLSQRIAELENLLLFKDEELAVMVAMLGDLEKKYIDSKREIERLLNEEKLNMEEKFVEPFQQHLQIPVQFELEALNRTLGEEKQKLESLKYELSDKDNAILLKTEEIQNLNSKIVILENKLRDLTDEKSKQKLLTDESFNAKAHLEKIITELQEELESSNLQLSVTKRELEEFKHMKDDALSNLKSQLFEVEAELVDSTEKKNSEIAALKSKLSEKSNSYEKMLESRREEEERMRIDLKELEKAKSALEEEVHNLRIHLQNKEKDIVNFELAWNEDKNKLTELNEVLEFRQNEVDDLRETLSHLQEEIGHFRNFEKQVKELRVAQLKEGGSDVIVTTEGDPDLSDWTEHELAELSSRLQSDLDTALYMLHQRDVRCDELTYELMQLLEERDTLQLRLSTALRINEEFRSLNKTDNNSSSRSLQESKDLVDQSNDRQAGNSRAPGEDLRQLAEKISELHSVSYLRDKSVKDDSVQRHNEQMNLLSRVSDSEISLTRDVQSSPAVFLNWVRGKTTPKVMHI